MCVRKENGSGDHRVGKVTLKNDPLKLRQMVISKWEAGTCFSVFISVVVYVLYQGFKAIQYNDLLRDDMIRRGFLELSFFGFGKDTTNRQWNNFKTNFGFMRILIPYTVISCILRPRMQPEKWSVVCSILSSLVMLYTFGLKGACVLIFIVFFHFLFYLIRPSPLSIWIGHLIIGLSTNLDGVVIYLYRSIDRELFDTFYACCAVVAVKALMFFMDMSKDGERRMSKLSICSALQYIFYPTNMIFGPIVAYSKFRKGVLEPQHMKMKEIAWRSIRLITWFFVMELLLYIPANAMLTLYPYSQSIINSNNVGAIYGYFYLLGINFYLLYVEAYGWSYVLGRADGFDVPDWPTCITVVYSYAEMWRVFDRGIYDFISIYVYRPLVGVDKTLIKKIFGSLMCFLYVILYHGLTKSVIVWVTLNFIQILTEMSLIHFYYFSNLSSSLRSQLSVGWTRRLVSVLGGISGLLSTYAFFCFDIGVNNTWNIFRNNLTIFNHALYAFILYFVVQSSIECRVRRLL